MALKNPNEIGRVARQPRREKMDSKPIHRSGRRIAAEPDDCPPDLAAELMNQLVALDQAPQTTHFDQLRHRGISLPAPATLSDEQLRNKLEEVVRTLAEMNVFICSTNHLNDRQLYDRLWSDVLHEWTMDAEMPDMTCYLDLVGSGSDKDIADWLRYYADAEDRARWQRDFPCHALPTRAKPAFNRDRSLPRPRET